MWNQIIYGIFVGFKNVSVLFFSMCTSKTEKINLTHISCKWVESANYTIRPWVQIWVSKKYDNNIWDHVR